jgi:hypothetical protein
MDGGDDLGVVIDPAQIPGRDRQVEDVPIAVEVRGGGSTW